MSYSISCFIPAASQETLRLTRESLVSAGISEDITVVADKGADSDFKGFRVLKTSSFASTSTMKSIGAAAEGDYILLYIKPFRLNLGSFAIDRMVQVCEDTGAGLVYSDYYEDKEGRLSPHPVTDYQEGSLRDDFNFGSLLLYRRDAFARACSRMDEDYEYAGIYDLRLKVSQDYRLIHLPELLYTEIETDLRKSGEKQFDYVDPKNRAVQVEMEKACTRHLKDIGAWLAPVFREADLEATFENEASVIIPVRNRVKTLGDAIESVLSQKCSFSFNLIVIDNHSADGTTELIKKYAASDKRIIHIIPQRRDLGIGGCWNEGIFSPHCGKFAIQLDSDDLYIDNNVVSRIVAAFHEQKCAMVVGSYKMVNFSLQDIPPGLIDHREWTPDNGRNNALRINGLGAPRAFYTPVLRSIRIPNTSYGEDYAVGLAISRHYRIGRIWEPLYLCRRWDENSDSALDINKTNSHNNYKDRLRTIELLARKKLNMSEKQGA